MLPTPLATIQQLVYISQQSVIELILNANVCYKATGDTAKPCSPLPMHDCRLYMPIESVKKHRSEVTMDHGLDHYATLVPFVDLQLLAWPAATFAAYFFSLASPVYKRGSVKNIMGGVVLESISAHIRLRNL